MDSNQYTKYRTDGTSGAIGRGVAESHDLTQYAQETRYIETRYTQLAQYTNVLNHYYRKELYI